jgi:hypothetical protein
VEDVLDTGGTPRVIDRLNCIVAELDGLVAYAKGPDGKPRNSKLLLSSVRELRGCIETGLKLYQAMRSIDQVDAFHAAIIEEIAKEAPELAERLLQRLDHLSTNWLPTP